MPDPLRDIILHFREAALPTGVPRRVEVTPVPGKATVCIGPRRAVGELGCSAVRGRNVAPSGQRCNAVRSKTPLGRRDLDVDVGVDAETVPAASAS